VCEFDGPRCSGNFLILFERLVRVRVRSMLFVEVEIGGASRA
jgi:hypothetical protein